MFPWLRPFVVNQQRIVNNVRETFKQSEELLNGLKKTLNPQEPRGIADSFLIRQQKDEVLSILYFKSNRFVVTIFDFHCHDFCRNLAKQTLCTIQWIYNVQSTTCLVLVLTLQPQRYAGVFCSWPNTLKYKVTANAHLNAFIWTLEKILLKQLSLLSFIYYFKGKKIIVYSEQRVLDLSQVKTRTMHYFITIWILHLSKSNFKPRKVSNRVNY